MRTCRKWHSSTIWALLAIRNSFLACGSNDNDKPIKIWNVNVGRLIKTLEGHTGNINALLLLEKGCLVSASTDRTIKTWNTKIN
jgi:WD40 repeat protein